MNGGNSISRWFKQNRYEKGLPVSFPQVLVFAILPPFLPQYPIHHLYTGAHQAHPLNKHVLRSNPNRVRCS